jgi:UDP-2-acetamido-2-deoxy-ribo-hexuluronate aminotransferase
MNILKLIEREKELKEVVFPLALLVIGGADFTSGKEFIIEIKQLPVPGQNKRYRYKHISLSGRMDTSQCAIIRTELKYYDRDLVPSQEVTNMYIKALDKKATLAWFRYSICTKNRDSIQAKLKEQSITIAMYYQIALYLHESFAYLGYKEGDFPVAEKVSNEIMSLPMNPYLSDDEIEYISNRI